MRLILRSCGRKSERQMKQKSDYKCRKSSHVALTVDGLTIVEMRFLYEFVAWIGIHGYMYSVRCAVYEYLCISSIMPPQMPRNA